MVNPIPPPVDVQSGGTTNVHSSDLITSLPAPLLRLLVIFARPIAAGKVGLETLLWKTGRRVESWTVVLAWWGVCIGGKYAFRYLLPPLLFFPLLPLSKLRLGKKTVPPKHDAEHPTTHDVLLVTLSDLHAINALLPPSPIPTAQSVYERIALLGPLRLTRAFVILWVTWVVLGRLIGYSVMLGVIGSIILLLPSPFLAHTLNLLSRSLMIRRLAALTFLLVFGSPPDHSYPMSLNFSASDWIKTKWATSRRPSLAFTFRPKVAPIETSDDSAIQDDDDEITSSPPIYFRFEVHENQRWWMGLDWTSALLPQERPSWCDSHLLPASPPASFPLPPPSFIILPNPTKAEPNGRVKRMAEWKWLDDDWSVVRAGQGATNSAPITVSSPTIPEDDHSGFKIPSARNSVAPLGTSPPTAAVPASEENQSTGARAQSIAEQAFTKGLERLKARTTSPATTASRPQSMIMGSSPQRSSGEFKRGRRESQASEDARELDMQNHTAPLPTETIVEKDDATDAEGWVYGDNKWENMGPKGGLGRFTRRRRWQRRAVLTETIIRLPPGPVETSPEEAEAESPHTPLKSKASVAPQPVVAEMKAKSEQDQDLMLSRERTRSNEYREPNSMIPPSSPSSSRDDVLRQRLKKAMGNVGG